MYNSSESELYIIPSESVELNPNCTELTDDDEKSYIPTTGVVLLDTNTAPNSVVKSPLSSPLPHERKETPKLK